MSLCPATGYEIVCSIRPSTTGFACEYCGKTGTEEDALWREIEIAEGLQDFDRALRAMRSAVELHEEAVT